MHSFIYFLGHAIYYLFRGYILENIRLYYFIYLLLSLNCRHINILSAFPIVIHPLLQLLLEEVLKAIKKY
jgi:hypothetical protein